MRTEVLPVSGWITYKYCALGGVQKANSLCFAVFPAVAIYRLLPCEGSGLLEESRSTCKRSEEFTPGG